MSSIKLISLNIERSKHLDLVIPFLEREKPDIVCLQELHEKDIPLFQKVLGDSFRYSASRNHVTGEESSIDGEAVFSRAKTNEWFAHQYAGPEKTQRYEDKAGVIEKNNSSRRGITGCRAKFADAQFVIITTHFTWTPDGEADSFQREDIQALLNVLQQYPQFVLCGDFNAPRGGEIFSLLADKYQDNIPPEYKTSLDLTLHRAGNIIPEQLGKLMVDGLFSTPQYEASNVRLEFGVSDHAAIVATIRKRD